MHSSVSSFCQFSFRSLPPLSLLQSLNFPPPHPLTPLQSSESECENDDEGDQLDQLYNFLDKLDLDALLRHCFLDIATVFFINM